MISIKEYVKLFLTITFYQFFKNDSIFINNGLNFGEDILYNVTISNFKSK